MEDFLVLGIVPNTDIQISFIDWIILVQVFILAVLTARLLATKLLSLRTAHLNRKVLHLLTVHHLL